MRTTPDGREDKLRKYMFYLSHDLRRPLANLAGICEILKSKDKGDLDQVNAKLFVLLKKTLAECDEVLIEYDKLCSNAHSEFLRSEETEVDPIVRRQ